MRVRVVDASALGALVFGEPRAEEVGDALAGGPMVAPALLWFEMASICLRKIRSYPLETAQILKAFNLVSRLDIDTIEVDHSAIVDLAMDTGLTTYDASYLWIALHLRGKLVTLDETLRNAAKAKSVAIS